MKRRLALARRRAEPHDPRVTTRCVRGITSTGLDAPPKQPERDTPELGTRQTHGDSTEGRVGQVDAARSAALSSAGHWNIRLSAKAGLSDLW